MNNKKFNAPKFNRIEYDFTLYVIIVREIRTRMCLCVCMNDADSGSPTTEQNLENVFQLIHRINFIFGNTHDAHTDDDIQH